MYKSKKYRLYRYNNRLAYLKSQRPIIYIINHEVKNERSFTDEGYLTYLKEGDTISIGDLDGEIKWLEDSIKDMNSND